MIVYKDDKKLNSDFPFDARQYTLKRENNAQDHYHYHDFYEITYVISGSGEYSVDGKCYKVGKGDIITFNNIEPHSWNVISDEMDVYVITFSPAFITGLTSAEAAEYLQPFVERDSRFVNKIAAEEKEAGYIYRSILEIISEYTEQDTCYRSMIRADVLRILTYLIRHYEMSGEASRQRKRDLKRMENAFRYIEQNYMEKIRLEDAAASVYMSSNYFSSFFKKVTGRTFTEYVNMLRLNKVRQLYLTTDGSLSDIALACGFNNLSNFYRLYKKYLGPLPEKGKIVEPA